MMRSPWRRPRSPHRWPPTPKMYGSHDGYEWEEGQKEPNQRWKGWLTLGGTTGVPLGTPRAWNVRRVPAVSPGWDSPTSGPSRGWLDNWVDWLLIKEAVRASNLALRDSAKETTVTLRESTWDWISPRIEGCEEGLESAGGGGAEGFNLEESFGFNDLRYFA